MDANDITLLAADRLEAALERLAEALEARERRHLEARQAAVQAAREAAFAEAGALSAAAPADMVSRADIERLSARLDEALGKLRALVGDESGAEI